MIENYYQNLHLRIENEDDENYILDQSICFQIYQAKLAKKRVLQFSQTINQLILNQDNQKTEETQELLQTWGDKI